MARSPQNSCSNLPEEDLESDLLSSWSDAAEPGSVREKLDMA